MFGYIWFRLQEKLFRSMGLSRYRWLGRKGSYLLGRLYWKYGIRMILDESGEHTISPWQ